jgi:signal transduction histidine kinase
MKSPEELKKLKDKMIALQSGDYDIEAENPRIVKCWERLNCDKTDCPAYGKLRCWSTAGTFCHGEIQGQFARKIKDCRKCVVYQESCGDDVAEVIEVFNQMVKDLKFDLIDRDKRNQEKSHMDRLSVLEEMAATIAHETRNPLHSIGMAASYLKKNFRGKLVTEFVSVIEEEVSRLSNLISLLLGFSQPSPLQIERCDIHTVVASAIELLRQEARDRGIDLIVEPDETLPPVECDPWRVKEALLKLMENAMEVSDSGDRVTVRTGNGGNCLTISVEDMGPGIPEEDLQRIFRPFYTTKTRGPGLGLAVVERTVREHEGKIEVTHAPGKGTRFSMVLPMDQITKE